MTITTNTYYQLTDSILLEWRYNSLQVPLSGNESAGILDITNPIDGANLKISYNQNNPAFVENTLKNDISTTAVRVSSDVWLKLDNTQPFTDFEKIVDNLQFEPKFQNIQPGVYAPIKYDRVRIYITQGFQFTQIQGILAEIYFRNRAESGTPVYVASQILSRNVREFQYLSRPLFIGQRSYLQYFEFYVPSLAQIAERNGQIPIDFIYEGDALDELYVNSELGIVDDTFDPKIYIRLWQINNFVQSFNNQTFLYCTPLSLRNGTQLIPLEIPKQDSLLLLGSQIQESEFGDYFEYYPVYNEGSIQEYVQTLTSTGKTIEIEHTIQIVEHLLDQTGHSADLVTQYFTHTQYFDFDDVNIIRPVIRYASSVAFTIDYTYTIVNITDNTRVSRNSTLLYDNPRKYGRTLPKLETKLQEAPIVIYNKVQIGQSDSVTIDTLKENILMPGLYINPERSTTSLGSQSDAPGSLIPIDVLNISAGVNTSVVASSGSVLTQQTLKSLSFSTNDIENAETIYSQGTAVINLNVLNNFIKFRFYDVNNNNPSLITSIVNSDETKYYLGFSDNQGNISPKIPVFMQRGVSFEPGELVFNISPQIVRAISSYTNTKFYIILNTRNGSLLQSSAIGAPVTGGVDVLVYQGHFMISASESELQKRRDQYMNQLLDNKIKKAEDLIQALQTEWTKMLTIIEQTKISNDNLVALNQGIQIDESQKLLEDLIIEQGLAEQLGISQVDLISRLRQSISNIRTENQ